MGSAGLRCIDRSRHRADWVVTQREHNRSAFAGYRRTPSAYSQVLCRSCGHTWRTCAAYVSGLPDAAEPTEHPAGGGSP